MAKAKGVKSSPAGPIICTPTGSPELESPTGIVVAGRGDHQDALIVSVIDGVLEGGAHGAREIGP